MELDALQKQKQMAFHFNQRKLAIIEEIKHYIELNPGIKKPKLLALCSVKLGLSKKRAREYVNDLITAEEIAMSIDGRLTVIKKLVKT